MEDSDCPFDWSPGTENAVGGRIEERTPEELEAFRLLRQRQDAEELANWQASTIIGWTDEGQEARWGFSPLFDEMAWILPDGHGGLTLAHRAYEERPSMVHDATSRRYRLVDEPSVKPTIVGKVPHLEDGSCTVAWAVERIGNSRMYRVLRPIKNRVVKS